MRGEVFPVLKGRGFRSSSVPGCEPPAGQCRLGRQAENLPEKASDRYQASYGVYWRQLQFFAQPDRR
ncbi:hypothetical protein YDC107_5459 [Escherichia phage YDC107_2]|nr:hypothetical protein YDC107_5459 [Escherichia phage YDC107_2]